MCVLGWEYHNGLNAVWWMVVLVFGVRTRKSTLGFRWIRQPQEEVLVRPDTRHVVMEEMRK